MLYHVSPTPGITVLEPRRSTHGTAYVYAIADRVTGLLFGAKQDDFDFCINVEAGEPALWECYPGALRERYEGKSCTVYEVEEDGFLQGQTGWEPEWVNPEPVRVKKETPVPDLLSELLLAEKNGALVIRRYEDTPEYRRFVSRHVVDRLVRFGCIDTKEERLLRHYGQIIALLREAVSGECLVNSDAHA